MLYLLAGCIDYALNGEKQVAGPVDSADTYLDSVTDTYDTVDERCPTEPLPGFPGSSDSTCAATNHAGLFDPVLEWGWTENAAFPSDIQVMATPAVGDINGDGMPDIVFTTYSGTNWSDPGALVALSGNGGAVEFELSNAGGYPFQGAGGVALGDLDGDGRPEICLPGSTKAVICLEGDGTLKWAAGSEMSNFGGPAIADLDGDGRAELILGRQIFDSDGNTLAVGSGGRGGQVAYWDGTTTAASFAADMDGDGQLEIVAGNTVYRKDGTTLWDDGGPDGFPAVADFDDDGEPEVVKVSGGMVTLTDNDGSPMWSVAPGFGGYGGPPTVADFDGDGEPEIGIAGATLYQVLRRDGTLLWEVPVADYSSNMTGSSVFDFEGDGVAEVVYADEEALRVFDGATGAVELEDTDHASATAFEYPVIADVDGDGSAEIVLASNDTYRTGWHGIHVIGDATSSWRPGRPEWNQYAYSLTNINDDLSVPTAQAPNWASYNNFRSGDPATGFGSTEANPTLAPGDVCQVDCNDGRLVVWIHPGNTGAVDQRAGSTVSLYSRTGGIETLLETQATGDLPAGTYSESLVFDISGVGPIDSLVARISVPDPECVEADDELVIDGPFCP